jgi:hypothetical protein
VTNPFNLCENKTSRSGSIIRAASASSRKATTRYAAAIVSGFASGRAPSAPGRRAIPEAAVHPRYPGRELGLGLVELRPGSSPASTPALAPAHLGRGGGRARTAAASARRAGARGRRSGRGSNGRIFDPGAIAPTSNRCFLHRFSDTVLVGGINRRGEASNHRRSSRNNAGILRHSVREHRVCVIIAPEVWVITLPPSELSLSRPSRNQRG